MCSSTRWLCMPEAVGCDPPRLALQPLANKPQPDSARLPAYGKHGQVCASLMAEGSCFKRPAAPIGPEGLVAKPNTKRARAADPNLRANHTAHAGGRQQSERAPQHRLPHDRPDTSPLASASPVIDMTNDQPGADSPLCSGAGAHSASHGSSEPHHTKLTLAADAAQGGASATSAVAQDSTPSPLCFHGHVHAPARLQRRTLPSHGMHIEKRGVQRNGSATPSPASSTGALPAHAAELPRQPARAPAPASAQPARSPAAAQPINALADLKPSEAAAVIQARRGNASDLRLTIDVLRRLARVKARVCPSSYVQPILQRLRALEQELTKAEGAISVGQGVAHRSHMPSRQPAQPPAAIAMAEPAQTCSHPTQHSAAQAIPQRARTEAQQRTPLPQAYMQPASSGAPAQARDLCARSQTLVGCGSAQQQPIASPFRLLQPSAPPPPIAVVSAHQFLQAYGFARAARAGQIHSAVEQDSNGCKPCSRVSKRATYRPCAVHRDDAAFAALPTVGSPAALTSAPSDGCMSGTPESDAADEVQCALCERATADAQAQGKGKPLCGCVFCPQDSLPVQSSVPLQADDIPHVSAPQCAIRLTAQ